MAGPHLEDDPLHHTLILSLSKDGWSGAGWIILRQAQDEVVGNFADL